jgi:hypothetical protein
MRDIIKLQQSVNLVIDLLAAAAMEHRCRLLNHISPDTILVTDREAFLFIMRRLLWLVIDSSRYSNIGISELIEGDRLLVLIKDDNNDYKGYISGKMEKHQSIMQQAGCRVNFEFHSKQSITVILHFNNK